MNSLIIIFISILFSAFFSGMEIAYISSNKLKIELDKNKLNSFSAFAFQRILCSPSNFISTMLVGNNISLVIYGISMAKLLEPKIEIYIQSSLLILLFQTLISTLVILVTAEFFPKVFFRLNPNRLLRISVIPLIFFHFLLLPIVTVVLFLSKSGLKMIGLSLVEDSLVFGKIDLEEYLKVNLNENAKKNIDVEVQILQNALDFSNIKIRESMLPRTDIIAVEVSKPIDDLVNIFIETKLSKVLIYKENIDNIIGYTHSNEIFKSPKNIISILIPISYVPESMMANDMLTLFIKERKGIAVVVDEFGGTSGIITLEDVVEEIFGEIEDEHDNEKDLEIKLNDTSFRFSARLEIDYLNNKYKFNLPKSEEYETLGGLLISKLEDIPVKNTEIKIGNFVIVVDEVSETKILSVSLIKTD
ncbi:MAG: hemolysin [Flavobacteriales bacterium]|nr:hemolysin [Flavobacteriales bacterium]|tara:strand:+ start:3951 stop:5201 length:1251 start_codon:yes stop_codon:yes gene_type:complete